MVKMKQEFHAFETIPACGTSRRVQVLHLYAGKDAWEVEATLPEAENYNFRSKHCLEINKCFVKMLLIFIILKFIYTWSSCGCPAENGTQGIPLSGCNKKLNGLLSTMTIRERSFDKPDKSFTWSLYSLRDWK